MSGPLPVHVVNSAGRAIKEASEWWIANRPKAPDAFREELERALQLIASHPFVGARAQNISLTNVRRVHLARIHYHLYYRVRTNPPAIEVLAFWHTSRGAGPSL